jgi:hypothetical protein
MLAMTESPNINHLKDFVEKLQILQIKGLVGEWDFRTISFSESIFAFAVVIDSVWFSLIREYNVIYTRETIKELVKKIGGELNGRHLFASSMSVWKTWETKKSDSNSSSEEPGRVPKQCILIPVQVNPDYSVGIAIVKR